MFLKYQQNKREKARDFYVCTTHSKCVYINHYSLRIINGCDYKHVQNTSKLDKRKNNGKICSITTAVQ